MRNEKTMLFWLWVLRIVILINIGFVVYNIFFSMKYWKTYFIINAFLIVFGYLWFNYIRLFYNKMTEKRFKDSEEPYSIVVPCYNEEPELLKQSVESLLKTDDNKKEIIIVDDGSTNNIWNTIEQLKKSDKRIIIYQFSKNKGKRFAYEFAVKKSKYDYIISMDSDTIVEKNAIRRLLSPFSNKNIGATTGNVLIKNEKQNLLTRIQAGIYWVGLNIYKRGQSTQGNVVCCSGCLSAYRKDCLLKVLDEFANQTFCGKRCHASEDRYLTNLIKELGNDIYYVDDALCYTEAPHTFKKWIKQQIRWKRGFFREATYTATYSWKVSKMLYFENLLWLMLPTVMILPTVLMSYYVMIIFPVRFFLITMPINMLFLIGRDSLFFIEEPKKAIHYILFVPIYLFIMYPLNIYAIFNSNPEKWGTR